MFIRACVKADVRMRSVYDREQSPLVRGPFVGRVSVLFIYIYITVVIISFNIYHKRAHTHTHHNGQWCVFGDNAKFKTRLYVMFSLFIGSRGIL